MRRGLRRRGGGGALGRRRRWPAAPCPSGGEGWRAVHRETVELDGGRNVHSAPKFYATVSPIMNHTGSYPAVDRTLLFHLDIVM